MINKIKLVHLLKNWITYSCSMTDGWCSYWIWYWKTVAGQISPSTSFIAQAHLFLLSKHIFSYCTSTSGWVNDQEQSAERYILTGICKKEDILTGICKKRGYFDRNLQKRIFSQQSAKKGYFDRGKAFNETLQSKLSFCKSLCRARTALT